MVKSVFVFIVLFGLIGIAAYFFVQKNNSINQEANILQVAGLVSPSPKPQESSVSASGQLIQLPSGIGVQDLVIGPGQEVRTGDIIAVNYVAKLENGTEVDSSYVRGQPLVTIIGAGKVIRGWDLGIPGMKIGGKRRLVIPAEFAYGTEGNGPIPPNANLTFEVEMLDAKSGGQ